MQINNYLIKSNETVNYIQNHLKAERKEGHNHIPN